MWSAGGSAAGDANQCPVEILDDCCVCDLDGINQCLPYDSFQGSSERPNCPTIRLVPVDDVLT